MKFRNLYREIYFEGINIKYVLHKTEESKIVTEIKRVYELLASKQILKTFNKFNYICEFIDKEVINKETEQTLTDELSNHIIDLNTYKEADLCDSRIIKDQIFISTVHKAKGLEFENVIVSGCVEGIYPFFKSKDNYAIKEDARKLYVAITRAKKRLCLLAYKKQRGWNKELSPFLKRTIKNFPFVKSFDEDL